MNKEQLQQLGHLNKEIEMLKKQLSNIRPEITTDSVKGSDAFFPYIQHTMLIRGWKDFDQKVKRLENQIRRRVEELMDLVDEINEYISSIPDSEIRQIITLRYVNNLTWQQVAEHIGGGNTADSVRKIQDRFLVKR